MKNVIIIFGYGIPKNILKDENYNFYLKMIFNKIYDLSTKKSIDDNPIIICSGGKTDIYKPYHRSEAEEMIKFFKAFTKKPYLKEITKKWNFVAEKTSLSTLENFLNTKKILNYLYRKEPQS